MDSKEAGVFLALLKTPPLDSMAIIEKYNIQARDRGILSVTARELLLKDPALGAHPTELQRFVDRAIGQTYKTASEDPAPEAMNREATTLHTAGILDRVKAVRMEWLWGYDETKDRLYIRRKALYAIEHIFYDYMGSQGWPKPVKDWVLTMAIVGGAASLQWKPGSDVDISIVVDWWKIFKQMEGWNRAQWKAVYLEEQYDRVQKGQRIQGTLVAKQMVNCLWGFGPWKGKGIIDKGNVDPVTMGHPVNYRFVRALSSQDSRFDSQPPIVENASISSFVAELPTERRREEDPNLPKLDVNWVQKTKDLPRGFDLKRDIPAVYDEALGLLRFMTMPFDYLMNPKTPADVSRSLKVLYDRHHRVKHDLRTEGYKKYEADPNAHAFVLNGETYALPDAFPANISIKLLEKSGSAEAIQKLLFEMKSLRDDRYVAHNFAAVKAEIRSVVDKPYDKVKEYLKGYSKPITYVT